MPSFRVISTDSLIKFSLVKINVMSGTDFFSCDELDCLLRRDSKHMEYKGKVISCPLLDKIEIFDKVLIWNTSCFTN